MQKWLIEFPGLVLYYFHREIRSYCTSIERWSGSKAITDPPKFIWTEQANEYLSQINNHIDFSREPADVVFPLTGFPGTGKTRLIYEILNKDSSNKSLVIYAQSDKNLDQLINNLLNEQSTNAIIVIDECSLKSRENLNDRLNGRKENIRVITIENRSELQKNIAASFVLKRCSVKETEEILTKNFPHQTQNNIRHIANYTEGYLRLAIILGNDPHFTDEAPANIKNYLSDRFKLSKDENNVLMVLSLFLKIGFKDDRLDELKAVCTNFQDYLGFDHNNFIRIANKLVQKMGSVAKAGRYYYLIPKLIARSYFNDAWDEFAKDRLCDFRKRIPPQLLEQFINRVTISSNSEAKNSSLLLFLMK